MWQKTRKAYNQISCTFPKLFLLKCQSDTNHLTEGILIYSENRLIVLCKLVASCNHLIVYRSCFWNYVLTILVITERGKKQLFFKDGGKFPNATTFVEIKLGENLGYSSNLRCFSITSNIYYSTEKL